MAQHHRQGTPMANYGDPVPIVQHSSRPFPATTEGQFRVLGSGLKLMENAVCRTTDYIYSTSMICQIYHTIIPVSCRQLLIHFY